MRRIDSLMAARRPARGQDLTELRTQARDVQAALLLTGADMVDAIDSLCHALTAATATIDRVNELLDGYPRPNSVLSVQRVRDALAGRPESAGGPEI